MPRSVPIRQLAEDSAEAWWALRLAALQESPGAFSSSYEDAVAMSPDEAIRLTRRRLGAPNAFTLGAFAGDQLIGMVTCVRATGSKELHKASVVSMYVRPEARGQGVGKALMAELIRRARSWPGLELLELSVVTEQEAARRLYRGLGFRPWGLERRALKLGDRHLDEEHLVLDVRSEDSE